MCFMLDGDSILKGLPSGKVKSAGAGGESMLNDRRGAWSLYESLCPAACSNAFILHISIECKKVLGRVVACRRGSTLRCLHLCIADKFQHQFKN